MTQYERQQSIINLLPRQPDSGVAEIASTLGVFEGTVCDSTGFEWDVSSLWREIKNRIAISVKKFRLESLAHIYRLTLKQLEELTGRRLDPIYIIGDRTQYRLLNQLTADCTRCIVVTGPVEAIAIGNVLMQAVALGHLESSSKARTVVRRSIEVATYFPTHQDGWDKALTKLVSLLKAEKG
jgi:hypothetical protein